MPRTVRVRRISPSSTAAPQPASPRPDPRVLGYVRQVALAGLALVLVWPAARGSNEWIGWLPMWLVGMPWLAWWAMLRFPLPRWQPRRAQARRRSRRATASPVRTA